MSVLLGFVAAMVLILIGTLRSKRPHEPAEQVLVQRYMHPGHAWARLTEDGSVVVGVDDFAQCVLGPVRAVRLPRLLHRVRQGTVSWILSKGRRTLPMVSPVSGWVIEKNEALQRNPGLINSSPYKEGWLFKVKPLRLSGELHNLMTGKAAHQWQDLVRARLSGFFSTTPALLFQDGGVMLDNLADRCSDEEWQALRKEFFFSD